MRDLSYTDENGKRIIEDGDFFIQVGNQNTKVELIK